METLKQSELNAPESFDISSQKGSSMDLEEFRLSQDFESLVGIKRETLIVPVRKPDRQSWFQIHSGEDWRMTVALIEIKEDRQNYLVSPKLYPELIGECTAKCLFTCQTRQKIIFLWPVGMPGPDGRVNLWTQSALQIVNEYAGRWIRVIANTGLGAYEPYITETPFDPPVWPPEGFKSLLQKAFRGKIIDTLEHPIIKMLRGQI